MQVFHVVRLLENHLQGIVFTVQYTIDSALLFYLCKCASYVEFPNLQLNFNCNVAKQLRT